MSDPQQAGGPHRHVMIRQLHNTGGLRKVKGGPTWTNVTTRSNLGTTGEGQRHDRTGHAATTRPRIGNKDEVTTRTGGHDRTTIPCNQQHHPWDVIYSMPTTPHLS